MSQTPLYQDFMPGKIFTENLFNSLHEYSFNTVYCRFSILYTVDCIFALYPGVCTGGPGPAPRAALLLRRGAQEQDPHQVQV